MENTGKLCSQEVALLAGIRRIRVDLGIQVTGEDVLDLAGSNDVLGLRVRKLNPVVQEVVRYPVS